MRWFAIVNPASHGNRTGKRASLLLSRLPVSCVEFAHTEYQGHATDLAAAAKSFDGIVVVGGDGTLFEVLRGMDISRQRLAILPSGTGNSLARDLGLYPEPRPASLPEASLETRVDLIRVSLLNDDGLEFCCLSASSIAVGYPAAVARLGNEVCKPLGALCYPIAAFLKTFQLERFTASLAIEGRTCEPKSLTGLIINNTRYIASFLAFPDASCRDGRFDVMEMEATCLEQNLQNFSALLGSRRFQRARLYQSTSVRIELLRPSPVLIDGEIFPRVSAIEAEIAPGALSLSGPQCKLATYRT